MLGSLNPHAVLERGYALAQHADGSVIRDAAKLVSGDAIQIKLARGRVGAEVRSVEPE
jgi:exodeoxyribonuclease VII large subunit